MALGAAQGRRVAWAGGGGSLTVCTLGRLLGVDLICSSSGSGGSGSVLSSRGQGLAVSSHIKHTLNTNTNILLIPRIKPQYTYSENSNT